MEISLENYYSVCGYWGLKGCQSVIQRYLHCVECELHKLLAINIIIVYINIVIIWKKKMDGWKNHMQCSLNFYLFFKQ